WDISLASAPESGDWVEWKNLREEFERIASSIYEVDFFNRSSQAFWGNVDKLLQVLRNEGFGILAPQSCVPASACLICKDLLLLNTPVVLTLHSWGTDRAYWMDLWDTWALSRVDHVCFVSEGYRDALLRRLSFKLDLGKTSVIKPGLHIVDDYPHKERLKETFGLKLNVPVNSFWITTLGGISERKGHLELIRAFRRLIEMGKDAYLFFIGPVREMDYFREMLTVFKEIHHRVK
ncbi:MAG: glycosyltransferase family 4 protein, partial [Chloroflexi bacterium]|nr:glycosyltransferase family 4 protein [Chloroflexota bacterium]